MRRSAAEVIRNLESRVASLEKQSGIPTSYGSFVKELARNVGVSTNTVFIEMTEWINKHPRPSFFRGGLNNCTFTFDRFKSNGYSGTMVEVDITNDRGDTRSETIEAFIDMSGRVKISSYKGRFSKK